MNIAFDQLKVAIFLLSVSMIFSCEKSGVGSSSTEESGRHELVHAFTSGKIPRDGELLLRLAEDLSPELLADAANIGEYLRFEPAVKGTWAIRGKRLVAFKPEGLWPAATRFSATARPEGLVGRGGKSGAFHFRFFTGTPRLSVQLDALEPQADGSYTLGAELLSDELLSAEERKGLLSLSYEGIAPELEWTTSGPAANAAFLVKNIDRGQGARSLLFHVKDSYGWGLEAYEKSVRIPALDEFSLLDSRVSAANPKGVVLSFSDPLDPAQELAGLVRIETLEGEYKAVRDGARLLLLPDEMPPGEQTVWLSSALKSNRGVRLGSDHSVTLHFTAAPPELWWHSEGSLLPLSAKGQVSFGAINLKAVTLEVFKVRQDNLLQYLQENAWGGSYYMHQVGYVVHREHLEIETGPRLPFNEKKIYTLDLSKWVDREPGAMYELRLGFNQWDAMSPCDWPEGDRRDSLDWPKEDEQSFWEYNYYGVGGYYEGFKWSDRDDPCKPAYYNRDRFISKSVLPVRYGVVAKANDEGAYWATVTELDMATPAEGVRVRWYNFQQEMLGEGRTDRDGLAELKISAEMPAFFCVVGDEAHQTIVRLQEGESQLLSSYDVGGKSVSGERDLFMYAERDLWRPGDSIHLFAMMRAAHPGASGSVPVRYRFRDPVGSIYDQGVIRAGTSQILSIPLKTHADARTGNWTAQIAVGDQLYSKRIAIEAIKPNRYFFTWKDQDGPVYDFVDSKHELQVQWLHGAPARDVAVVVEEKSRPLERPFEGYSDYHFQDVTKSWDRERVQWGSGRTDGTGQLVLAREARKNQVPGPAASEWSLRAEEPGGGFSADQISKRIYPYASYAGLRAGESGRDGSEWKVDEPNDIELLRLDAYGQPKSGVLDVEVMRVSWRWWWDLDERNSWGYSSRETGVAVSSGTVSVDARGKAVYKFRPLEWGRYLVKLCDRESGHCASAYFYAGSPSYADMDRSAAARINFTADKESYKPGDKLHIDLPSPFAGKALLSIEAGGAVVSSRWYEVRAGDNRIAAVVTEDMMPNCYAYITLLQSVTSRQPDFPMRMYGVLPVKVEDGDQELALRVDAPEKLAPGEAFDVRVSAESGRAMSYTIAVVDEGLLNLTRFQTPDPYEYYNQKEALTVKTWDMYDDLVLSSLNRADRLLAVGGDAAAVVVDGQQEANRFPPVVRVLGPFELGKGKTGKHRVSMPNYLGAVRLMVVAGGSESWGKWERRLPVSNPVMVFSGAPRVLSPGDKPSIPLTVITGEGHKGQVNWSVREENGLASFTAAQQGTISLGAAEEESFFIPASLSEKTGVAKFRLSAGNISTKVEELVEIPVRNANPYFQEKTMRVLQPGETVSMQYEPLGSGAETEASVQMMQFAPFSVDDKLKYLLNYPHGCLEQRVSKAFAQLYLTAFAELDEQQLVARDRNIQAVLDRLGDFSTGSGFAIWSGGRHINIWADIYAAHFILEAKALGYRIPEDLLKNWLREARRKAVIWRKSEKREGEVLSAGDSEQAYRLYVLALAGSPEKGAMNLLREQTDLSAEAAYFLGAAYALIARHAEADALLASAARSKTRGYGSYNYGSAVRHNAVALLCMTYRGDDQTAFNLLTRLGEAFDESPYFSTQDAGFAMLAAGKHLEDFDRKGALKVEMKANGMSEVITGDVPSIRKKLPVPSSPQRIELTNQGSNKVFVYMVRSGRITGVDDRKKSAGLELNVQFTDLNDRPIDVNALRSGDEFKARVRISRQPQIGERVLTDMAFSMVAPGGWELLDKEPSALTGHNTLQHSEKRDDRLLVYFDLKSAQTSFDVRLRAAYPGSYYMPPTHVEAMYDPAVQASVPGRRVEVVR